MLYFDNNATTPISELALDVFVQESRENWRNPSSPTRQSARVKNRLEALRDQLASLLNCDPKRLLFNSGATEGNNAVLRKYSLRGEIAISPFEHSSVYKPATFFSKKVLELSCNKEGQILDLDNVLLSDNVSLLAVQAANNETGIIQDWKAHQTLCRQAGIRYLCDAVQWMAKMPLYSLSDCDYVSATAHKFGGPKGVGFLIVADPMDSLNFIHGGEQEFGNRAGTENLPAIAAMIAALEEQLHDLESKRITTRNLREEFEESLLASIPNTELVGANVDRIPNTSFLIMPEFSSMKWIRKMEKFGVEISSASACSSQLSNVSKVAKSLGYSASEAARTIRVSASMQQTRSDWDELLEAFKKSWNELREEEQDSMVIKL